MSKKKGLSGVEKKGGTYYLQRRAPRDVWDSLGRKYLQISLKTDSESEAIKRAPAAREMYAKIIKDARSGQTLDEQAMELGVHLVKADEALDEAPGAPTINERRGRLDPLDTAGEVWRHRYGQWVGHGEALDYFLEDVERTQGLDRALELNEIARKGKKPLRVLFDKYLAAEPTSEADMRVKRTVFDLWMEITKARFVESVNRETKDRFIEELLRTRARSTVHNMTRKLSSFGAWLEKREYATYNIFKGMAVKAPPSKRRAFTDVELRATLEECREPLKSLVTVLALSGMRIQECLDVRERDVDFEKLAISVPGTKSAAAARQIPLHSQAISAIKNILPDDGQGLKQRTMYEAFIRAMQRAGIPESERRYLGFHSLRKRFYEIATQRDAIHMHLAVVIGHKLPDLVRTYGGLPTLEQKRAVTELVSLPQAK